MSTRRRRNCLSNLVNLRRTVSAANVNHYNVQPVYDVFANVQGRDLAAVAADVQRAIDAVRPGAAAGQHDRHARAGRDHEQLVHRAGGRAGVRRAPGLPSDGGQLSELARPVHHPHRPAGQRR